MGVTGTTAAGAYMMPPRPECRALPAASTTLSPPAAVPQAASQGEQPCRRRRWGTWYWGSGSYSSNRSQPLTSNRAPTSVSTALSGSRTTSTSTSAPRSGSTGTSRGGFGSTGHGMSSRSSGS